MSTPVALLDAIVRDALDPSYAEAAARRRLAQDASGPRRANPAGPPSGRRHPTSLMGIALLLAAGALAGVAVASQHQVLPEVGAARNALAGDAGERTRQLADLEQALAATQREVTALQQDQLQATSTGRSLERLTTALAAATAQTGVQGPGVTVTVADVARSAPGNAGDRPPGSRATRTGQVTDRDLQDVVNALWAGGAEAISVGGVRLGPQTAIRTAGQTILAQFQPLRSPYVIAAIGGPGLLAAATNAPAVEVLGQGSPGAHPSLAIRAEPVLHLPAASASQPRVAHPIATGGHS